MENTQGKRTNRILVLAIIPLFIGINVGIEAIVKSLSIPLFIDSIGTILATIILGWRSGIVVGTVGFILSTILFDPFAVYFVGTQAAIAIYISIVASKGGFKNILRTILSGAGLGVVAAVISAPVIIILFSGATGDGASLVIAFFVKMGHQIAKAVLMTGFSIEPIDKSLQCALAYFLLKNIPPSLLSRFHDGYLRENDFLPHE